jgi:TIR domain-containing protein
VPSAFISYAHEDQEFVLGLADHLRGQEGLVIRYDQVALHVGDSLIRAISHEIAEGDFLIAIVSPDSVESEWCQTELALARVQGINERRVKVLPVRFRGAEMPPMLDDTFWADADRDDYETLARRLVAAMMAHMEGRDNAQASRAAEAAAPEAEGEPAEAGPGEARVEQIDLVAGKVWDLFLQWEQCRVGAPTVELQDKQRRLQWEFEKLTEQLRDALPLVHQLISGGWNEYFRPLEPAVVAPDFQEEMRSVRVQVAQRLPITRRWTIDSDLGPVNAGNRDAVAHLWEIARGEETMRIAVYISGTAVASDNAALPQEVAQAKETNGRSVVATLLALDDPPREVMVSTAGIGWPLPE